MPATVVIWATDEGRQRILSALRALAVDGHLSCTQWNRRKPADYPSSSTVARSFGRTKKWSDVLVLAGLRPIWPRRGGRHTKAPQQIEPDTRTKFCECYQVDGGEKRVGRHRVTFASTRSRKGILWLCESCYAMWQEDEG